MAASWSTFPVIVVAQHGESSESGLEVAQHPDRRCNVAGTSRNIVACQKHEIGLKGIDRIDDVANIDERNEGTMMDVGNQGNRRAVKGSG